MLHANTHHVLCDPIYMMCPVIDRDTESRGVISGAGVLPGLDGRPTIHLPRFFHLSNEDKLHPKAFLERLQAITGRKSSERFSIGLGKHVC